MPALFDLVESEPEPVRASNPVVAVGTTIADRAPYRSVASRGEHCVHQSRHTLAYFSPIRCIGLTPRNRGYRAPSSGQPAVPWNAPSPRIVSSGERLTAKTASGPAMLVPITSRSSRNRPLTGLSQRIAFIDLSLALIV
jgi:hypothetical protein